MKEKVIKILKETLIEKKIDLKEEDIENLLEIPPSIEMGDFAFPCFIFSKKLKRNPNEISIELRAAIGEPSIDFEDIQTSGPYINFFVNKKIFSKKIIGEVLMQKENFGKANLGEGKKILIEFSSPNIAKPFGIGHLRSTIIGNSISHICENMGFETIKMNYLGDWGTQFGKLITGYEKFGDEKKLNDDPIKHLLEIYVKANKKIYEERSREWFKKLEEGNKEALELWQKFRELSLKDFEKIYKILGVSFDVYSGESMYSEGMQEVIKKLKDKKLLKKSKGALIVNLKKYKLGVVLIQKSDGATLYATRDIASAIERYEKYGFDKMFYEVGQEQSLHFQQIFKVLELMGYEWAKECKHISHGLYLGKNKKRFATRKGQTVFMQDIIEKAVSLAKKEIKKRSLKISKKDLEKRALKIAMGAILYGDLKNTRTNNIVFDIKKLVSFEGDTGPYIQYSYARANSILKKIKRKEKRKTKEFIMPNLELSDFKLVKKISEFPKVTMNAYENLAPSLIANYSYELAQIFNEFYHACPVIGSKQESFRIVLIEAFMQVLENALSLLGIKTLEEM